MIWKNQFLNNKILKYQISVKFVKSQMKSFSRFFIFNFNWSYSNKKTKI